MRTNEDKERHLHSLKLLDGKSLVSETQELKIHTRADNDKVGRQRGQRERRLHPDNRVFIWSNKDSVLKGRMLWTMHSISLKIRGVPED